MSSTDISRHVAMHGHCMSISGPSKIIKQMCVGVPKHITIEDGACHGFKDCETHTRKTGSFKGVTFTRCMKATDQVDPAMELMSADTFHAVTPNDKACVQMSGALMANP